MPADPRPANDVEDRPLRIGCGAGFSADRIDPAQDLAERGELDYLIFECLAERTLAQSHAERARDPQAGFNAALDRRIGAVLPACHKAGTRIVTNMGAANPAGAGARIAALAQASGLTGLRIAVVEGDDVTSLLTPEMETESGERLRDLPPVIGANAYLGADALLAGLETGADVVVSGRVADPSLVLAPLRHHFGWADDDWDLLGAGTLAGHLLECGAQVTGGYFSDPGYKDVPDLARIGYPIAEVGADGRAVITKLPETGGCVTPHTVKEQLLYEVHDPAAYLTPDVTADFSAVTVRESAPDRTEVGGAKGRMRPALLKVTAGFAGGYLAEAEIGYAGMGAINRARLAARIVQERMELRGFADLGPRIDLIGLNSLHGEGAAIPAAEPGEVRLRMAARSMDRAGCEALLAEVEALWIAGPAGGGGFRGRMTPSVTTRSLYLPRERIRPRITVLAA